MRFEPFQSRHLYMIDKQPSQADFQITPEVFEQAGQYPSWTGWSDDGRCLGCAGILPLTSYRGQAWALISSNAGPFLLPIARFVRCVVSEYPINRLEAHVLSTFWNGYKFAELCGFQPEGVARAYDAEGRDYMVFSRVRR